MIFGFFGTEPKTVFAKRDRDEVSHKGLPDSEKIALIGWKISQVYNGEHCAQNVRFTGTPLQETFLGPAISNP